MGSSNRKKGRRAGARTALLVLGSHRSGTSALTRCLSLSGARLPSHLVEKEDGAANDGNSKAGFWESRRFNAFHDEILRAAGSRWDDPRAFSIDRLGPDAVQSYTSQLAGLVDEEFGDSELFVAKDPRISYLAPLWKAALARLGVSTCWLIAARHPVEVAGSLTRRDGFLEAKGLLLWLNYTLAAESHSRGETRCFVGYDSLLSDWRATLSKVWAAAGVAPFAPDAKAAAAIDAFLDPGLRSQKVPAEATRPDVQRPNAQLPETIFRLWNWLGPACDSGAENLDEVREIHRIHEQAMATFQPLIGEAPSGRGASGGDADLAAKLGGLEERVLGLGRSLAEFGERDGESRLTATIAELTASMATLRERQEALRASDENQERLRQEETARAQALSEELAGLKSVSQSATEAQAQLARTLESTRSELAVLKAQREAPRVKALAFYLPQFHPIPENDEWWGKGFTEWSNVNAAQPLFKGHVQPAPPSELGYYDLRLPEVRERQAALAAEHGIHGFCYYYYWFNGKKLLERPLEEVLASGSPEFPFCICWANENWTRRWDGADSDILLAQEHSTASDTEFFEDVLPILLDPRYVRHNGEPVLLVYRASRLDNPLATTSKWREIAREAGLPGLHLCTVWHDEDPREIGFDALVEFPPHHFPHLEEDPEELEVVEDFDGKIFSYAAGVEAVEPLVDRGFPRYRAAMTNWDNTPRRGRSAFVYRGSTPELYEGWLEQIVKEAASRPGDDDQYVFINAWNEWAEGAVLEPTEAHGRGYLEATRAALRWGAARRSELDRFETRVSAHLARLDRSMERFGTDIDQARRESEAASRWMRSEGAEFQGQGLALGKALEDLRQSLSALSAESKALAAAEKKQDEGLAWLGSMATELESQRRVLGASVDWLKQHRAQDREVIDRKLETLARRQRASIALASTPSLGDLWWNSSYGLVASWLRAPWWWVTGRLRQRRSDVLQARLIKRSGLFDAAFYLEQNPDVIDSGLDPVDHYVRFGAGEGRSPSPDFDGQRYLERHPDLDPARENPLLHFLHGDFDPPA